nr:hypothetical protein 24 [bacterium]
MTALAIPTNVPGAAKRSNHPNQTQMSTTNDKPETNTKPILTSRAKKVRFYIPVGRPSSEEVVEAVMTKLSRRFGGATQFPAKGAYVMSDGELVREEVVVVDCFGVDGGLDELSTIAQEIKSSLGEESVAFEVVDVATAFA